MRIVGAIVVIFIIFPSAPATGDSLYLQIYQPERKEVLLEFPVVSGDRFRIRYTHSSDLTPVVDHFVIVEVGKMILKEEEFRWYGSGLEFRSTPDARVVLDDHRTRVFLHRPFVYIPIRVGRVAGHHVEINGLSIPLRRVAKGGERVWIRVVSDIAFGYTADQEGEINGR